MKSLVQRLFRRRAAAGVAAKQHTFTAAPVSRARINLMRTFVETGDQRCPLAGMWSGIAESTALAEEAESTWPVPRWLLACGRALFHPSLIRL